MRVERGRGLCRLAVAVLGLQGLAALWAFFFAGSFLAAPEDPPAAADLIVILGGGTVGARLETGARLYREGWAPRVLMTGFSEGNEAAAPWYLEWRVTYLTAMGLPRTAIIPDHTAQSSWMEIDLIRDLSAQSGWRRVLVVSDPPHLRRLSLVARKALAGSGPEVRFIGSRPEWWNARRWWAHSASASFVIMEWIKLGYYAAGERF